MHVKNKIICFIFQEVFKSDVHIAMPLDQVLGQCCVLSVKDYFRSKPEGFADKDVYVCESRYSTKARAFKKIKVKSLYSYIACTLPLTVPK